MKVIYADNWEERIERCKEINKKNRKNLIILKCLLTVSICGFFLAHIPYAIEYFSSVKLVIIFAIFSIYTFFAIWTFGASVVGKLFDEVTGENPIFTPVVDTEATLSCLLTKKNA